MLNSFYLFDVSSYIFGTFSPLRKYGRFGVSEMTVDKGFVKRIPEVRKPEPADTRKVLYNAV